MNKVKQNSTPFLEDVASGKTINFNGKDMSIAFYNLVVSKRDLKLWQVGMKPHRHWRVTDVKKYFGIKGNKNELVMQINNLCDRFIRD